MTPENVIAICDNGIQIQKWLIYCYQRSVRKGVVVMKDSTYEKVCYWTEQRDEPVHLQNLKTGEIGYSFGCTIEGATIQVKLDNGELDSWRKEDCSEMNETLH
jgi:hypothetical protein